MAESQRPNFTEEQRKVSVEVDGSIIYGHLTYVEPGDFGVRLDAMPKLSTGKHIAYVARGVFSYLKNGEITPMCYDSAQYCLEHLHMLHLLITNHGQEILETYQRIKTEIEASTEYVDRLDRDAFRALRNPIRTEMRKGVITPRQYEAGLKPLQTRLKAYETCKMKIEMKVWRELESSFGVSLHCDDAQDMVEILKGGSAT